MKESTRPSRTATLRAIRELSLPIAVGEERTAYAVARRLHRLFGVTTYLIAPRSLGRRATPLARLLALPYVRVLPCKVTSPALLAEATLALLGSASPTAFPVAVDCTPQRTLAEDPRLAERITAYALLRTLEDLTSSPPFLPSEPSDPPGSSEPRTAPDSDATPQSRHAHGGFR